MENSEETINYSTVIAYESTQQSPKCSMKELAEMGEPATTKDLSQLHMRDNFFSKSAEHLTEEQKRDALEYLIYFKVKRDGRVEGRT